MADGRHFENGFITVSQPRIFNEIWSATADFGSKDGHVTKYQNFANSKWRTAAILNIVFGYISTIYCPINAKCDMKKQNYIQMQVT